MDETLEHRVQTALLPDEKKVTLSEIKKLRKQFWTVQREVVAMCGHKIVHETPPKNNCEVCWFAWFQNHGELVQELDKCFTEEEYGDQILTSIWGSKFVKNFLAFMSTVANWKNDIQQEGNVHTNQ